MIIGIGTDIIEIERIAKSIENSHFKARVFSTQEIAYCENKPNKSENYAVRFAAKEAFFKALGTGLRSGMALTEVEVQNNDLGAPSLQISGITAETIALKQIKTIHISLSHTKNTATAMVVLEG